MLKGKYKEGKGFLGHPVDYSATQKWFNLVNWDALFNLNIFRYESGQTAASSTDSGEETVSSSTSPAQRTYRQGLSWTYHSEMSRNVILQVESIIIKANLFFTINKDFLSSI